MAAGQLGIAGVPMAYAVRHVPPRRKQAIMSAVCEETFHRVPGWSGQEAPAVATLESASGRQLVYRAACGSDGVLRLMAPLDSAAFLGGGDRQVARTGMPALSVIPMFRHGQARHVGAAGFKGRGDDLGTVLADERQQAVQMTADVVRTLATVDGQLHAPAPEPGWSVLIDDRSRWRYTAEVTAIKARPDPAATPADAEGTFVGFGADMRETVQELARTYPGSRWPIAPTGRIIQHVPGALGGDWMWRRMRHYASLAVHNDPVVPGYMLAAELLLRAEVEAALCAWPVQRDTALLRKTVRLVRTVHGIRSNGNADMFDSTMALAAELAKSPPPAPFGERLIAAGMPLPHLVPAA